MNEDAIDQGYEEPWKGFHCVCAGDDDCACGAAEGNGPCSNPRGHDWVVNEESDRCYCCFCGADGDA